MRHPIVHTPSHAECLKWLASYPPDHAFETRSSCNCPVGALLRHYNPNAVRVVVTPKEAILIYHEATLLDTDYLHLPDYLKSLLNFIDEYPDTHIEIGNLLDYAENLSD